MWLELLYEFKYSKREITLELLNNRETFIRGSIHNIEDDYVVFETYTITAYILGDEPLTRQRKSLHYIPINNITRVIESWDEVKSNKN